MVFLVVMTSLVTQMIKHPPTMRETQFRSMGWEDPLEKEMATHSSILAWRIPWTEEPGGLQSTGSQRFGHDWATSLSRGEVRPTSKSLIMSHLVPHHWSKHITGANPKSGGSRWILSTAKSQERIILSHWLQRIACRVLVMLVWVSRKSSRCHTHSQEAWADW